MARLIVEIHFPLVLALGVPSDVDQFGWIDDVEEFLQAANPNDGAEWYDFGEEVGAEYLFFVTGRDEESCLALAAKAAALPGVPLGAYVTVTSDEAPEMGQGRRVELPTASS